jgi:hypothetical protein
MHFTTDTVHAFHSQRDDTDIVFSIEAYEFGTELLAYFTGTGAAYQGDRCWCYSRRQVSH